MCRFMTCPTSPSAVLIPPFFGGYMKGSCAGNIYLVKQCIFWISPISPPFPRLRSARLAGAERLSLVQGQGPHYALEWMFVLRVFSSDRKSIFPSVLKDFPKCPGRGIFWEWLLDHLPFYQSMAFVDLMLEFERSLMLGPGPKMLSRSEARRRN